MGSPRSRIMAELDRQAQHEGETANIAACRVVVQHALTHEQLQSLLSIQHHRYGPLSYQTYRFYYVRDWVVPMVARLGGLLEDIQRPSA